MMIATLSILSMNTQKRTAIIPPEESTCAINTIAGMKQEKLMSVMNTTFAEMGSGIDEQL